MENMSSYHPLFIRNSLINICANIEYFIDRLHRLKFQHVAQ